MADIANIIAQVLGNVGQGLGDIQDRRRQQAQLQLQQRQVEQQQQQQQFEQLAKVYGSLSPDVDITPDVAQKFTSAGFSLNKGPSGMARRPQTPEELLNQRRLQATDLEIQGRQYDLEDTANKAKFRAALQVEGSGTMQALMSKPTPERDAFWASVGMSGPAPRTAEELAAEDVAKSAGELGVQKLQNQGYLASQNAALNRMMMNPNVDDVDPAKFDTFVNGMLAQDKKIQDLWETAKANGTMAQFRAVMMDEYRRTYKNMNPNATRPLQ